MTTVCLFLSVTSYLLSVTQEGAMIALSVRDRATSMILHFILGSTESCLRSVKGLSTWHRPGIFVCTRSLVYRKAAATEPWPTDSGLWHSCRLSAGGIWWHPPHPRLTHWRSMAHHSRPWEHTCGWSVGSLFKLCFQRRGCLIHTLSVKNGSWKQCQWQRRFMCNHIYSWKVWMAGNKGIL